MKKVIYAILVMILSMPLCGYTVKGGVTYTVETARKEAFADVEYTLPKSIINAHKTDPNYKENMKAKANGVNRLKDRRLVFFDDGTYGVIYYDNPNYAYYYENGKLEAIDKNVGTFFPIKTYRFIKNGELEQIILNVAPKESYMFELDGRLRSHWIGNKCYDLNGKVVARRY